MSTDAKPPIAKPSPSITPSTESPPSENYNLEGLVFALTFDGESVNSDGVTSVAGSKRKAVFRGTSVVAGKYGKGMRQSGKGGLYVGDLKAAEAVSICFWFRLDRDEGPLWFFNLIGSHAANHVYPGKDYVDIIYEGGLAATHPHFIPGQWHHVAFVWDWQQSHCKVYLDGDLHEQTKVPNKFKPGESKGADIGVCYDESSPVFDLDEFLVFDRQLERQEIRLISRGQYSEALLANDSLPTKKLVGSESRDDRRTHLPPLANTRLAPQPNPSSVDAIVSQVLAVGNNRYTKAGYKEYRWGDDEVTTQQKLNTTEEHVTRNSRGVFDNGKLVGIHISYQGDVTEYIKAIGEAFGSPHTREGMNLRYVFPSTIIYARIDPEHSWVHVYAQDRDHAVKLTKRSLIAIEPALERAIALYRAVESGKVTARDIPVSPEAKMSFSEIRKGWLNHEQRKEVWQKVESDSWGRYKSMLLVVSQWTDEFKRENADDGSSGDLAIEYWLRNDINDKQFLSDMDHVGEAVMNGIREMAVARLPPASQVSNRTVSYGGTAWLEWDWKLEGGASCVYRWTSEGPSIRLVRRKPPSL